jgi:outer membrane protein OmpA-like peptidoglycan-associated protein
MPQYVLQQQERIESAMQDISGQHEVSNAQVPAGVKAASAINLLQEADDTRLGPAIYDMEEAIGVAGERLLKLVAQYWTDERTILIAGKDHALDAMSFRGAALKSNTQVEVQSGSMFPKSKAAKQAAIQDTLNLYFQYLGNQPMNKRMLSKVMEDLEGGALSKLFGDISVSESQINRENQEIAQSIAIMVNPYDEHEVHIEGHEEYQRGPTYKQLGPVVNQIMEAHVNEHRQALLAAMGPMVQPAMPGQAPGGAQGAPGASNGTPTPTPTGGGQ